LLYIEAPEGGHIMKKTTARKMTVTIAAAAGLLVTGGLLSPTGVEASDAPFVMSPAEAVCLANTFSTCPDRCMQVCIPSSCEDGACSMDCDGPGSCQVPPTLSGRGDD
jgi:hypothetical protein